jgi:nucleoside-diphosphate-sugar epimerase
MKILVTGGTGFLGSRLIGRLLQEKHEVIVFCREKVPEMEEEGVKFFLGNIQDKVAVEKAVAEADIVYHLAICLDESHPDLRAINVEGTKNVIEACKQSKVRQLIYMGSSGVLGETKKPATEDLPYRPGTRYEKSKAEAEKLIKESGLPYTIIRTTIIIGPNLIWAAIFDAARKQYPVIGSGKNFWHLVYVDDVASLLAQVKGDKKALNQIFHVASPDTPTYSEVYNMMAEALGSPKPDKHVPVALAKFAAGAHEFSCKLRGKKPEVTKMRSSIDRLVRNRIIGIEKAKEVLGFKPKFATKQALEETVKYLGLIKQGYSEWEIAEVAMAKSKSW